MAKGDSHFDAGRDRFDVEIATNVSDAKPSHGVRPDANVRTWLLFGILGHFVGQEAPISGSIVIAQNCRVRPTLLGGKQ
jgi:hypothetical protein